MENSNITPLLILSKEEYQEFKNIVPPMLIHSVDDSGKHHHNIIEVYLIHGITVNQIWLYSRLIAKRLYFKNFHDVKYPQYPKL